MVRPEGMMRWRGSEGVGGKECIVEDGILFRTGGSLSGINQGN